MSADPTGNQSLAPAADGFYHPASEQDLVELVRMANRGGLQLRVRGAAHSVSHAIYTDPARPDPDRITVQTPPPGPNLNVMLDRYRGWRVLDEEKMLVEADAGIHIGPDPNDPTGGATLQTSLLWQLVEEKGWSLEETGGITHQTISGFTATGSAGGSTRFAATNNLWGFRFVDGRAQVHEVTREGENADLFYAMCPNLGLLGVVSKVILKCVPAFNIEGEEAITTVDTSPADLFGAGTAERPALEQLLRDTDYGRLVWWPQRSSDKTERDTQRVVTWRAHRIERKPGFKPKPYTQFGDDPEAEQYLVGLLFTIVGNLDDLSQAKPKLDPEFDQLKKALELLGEKDLGIVGKILGDVLAAMIKGGVDLAITALEPFAGKIKGELPEFLPKLVDMFNELDADKKGPEKGKPQYFHDFGWHGMPMDNQADDVLMPTEFTEAWLPLPRSGEALRLLRDYFDAAKDPGEALQRTGTYGWELYATGPEKFWLNAAHSDGKDEWRDGVFRIDPYWFVNNAEDPVEWYSQFWALLRDAGIPFRLHWGKFQPRCPEGDRDWIDFFRAQYPRWDDFLELRAERDPNNIFLTDYWRDRFGLWDEPEPQPRQGPPRQ
jgi:D-arabinono-1,4-lactone oxidase